MVFLTELSCKMAVDALRLASLDVLASDGLLRERAKAVEGGSLELEAELELDGLTGVRVPRLEVAVRRVGLVDGSGGVCSW